ncbi:hypothetical protein PISMIDRAFT_110685, partial [Pisolithus microcarpus 441]
LCKMVILAWKQHMDSLKAELPVGHLTMENADHNDKMMEALEEMLLKCDISFNRKDQHIHCLPHVLNICCGHVVDRLTNQGLIKTAGTWIPKLPEDLDDQQTYREALESDPIVLGHNIYKLSQMQGRVLRDFELALEIPHQAIWALSHEHLPTLCKYLVTFERFYDTWKQLHDDDEKTHLCPYVQRGLEWVEKYYHHMGDTKAYIISMHK